MERIENICKDITVDDTGFGNETTGRVEGRSTPENKFDLTIHVLKDVVFCKVEVSGSDLRNPPDYWVQAEKVEHTKGHPEECWVILVYGVGQESFIYIKIDPNKTYHYEVRRPNGYPELFAIIQPGDPAVRSEEEFAADIHRRTIGKQIDLAYGSFERQHREMLLRDSA